MSRPKLELLDQGTVERILAEAHELLWDPGVRIHSDEGLELVADAGATVDFDSRVANIPAELVDEAVETVPSSFYLYDYAGNPVVHYGGDDVHFDPGSAAIEFLDYGATQSRKPLTADFVAYIKLADMLPELDAVSTALVCSVVVTGPERGHIWLDGRAGEEGIAPVADHDGNRMSFSTWYTTWLDAALDGRDFR